MGEEKFAVFFIIFLDYKAISLPIFFEFCGIGSIVKRAIAAVAKTATAANVNSSCNFVIYQPKLPKGAEKLRKF